MKKKVKASARDTALTKPAKGFGHHLLKGMVVGIISFALCVLLMPLILMRTGNPGAFISAVSVGIMAITAFLCAFAASKGNDKHFVFTGVICALILCAVLVAISMLCSGENCETDWIFSAIICAVTCVFALFGSALGSKKARVKKHRKHHK